MSTEAEYNQLTAQAALAAYFFVQEVRKARLRKGWTQELLADKVGVTQLVISEWETGVVRPRLDILFRLVIVLEIPLAYGDGVRNEVDQTG